EGKTTNNAARQFHDSYSASGERFIVQFGSFADNTKAREARLKVEKAGFKTYVQVAETAQGKLIRVRVGPFATRAEADKAAAKIKSLDLPAAILTL
ncbi:MAG: SPOR domain-containing protein, partial [Brachymonas sp.]|nr:SPOR domain-containing protein [Brachymonas sp.]